jgi:hypothetical protein
MRRVPSSRRRRSFAVSRRAPERATEGRGRAARPRGRIGGSHGQSLRSSRPFVETAGMRSSSNRRRAVNGSSPFILLLCGGEYSAAGGTVGKVTGNLRTLRGVSTPTCGNPVTTRLQGFSQTRQAHPEKSQTGDVPSRGREAAEGAATSRGAADLAGLSAGRLSPLEAPRRSRSPTRSRPGRSVAAVLVTQRLR